MKRSENGFTLLEMLLSLMIFLLIMFLIPMLLKTVLVWTTTDKTFNEFEWQVFVQQTKMEIKESTELIVCDDLLSFIKNNGQVVTYEKYHDKMRRKVDGSGHEIILQNVNTIHFSPENNGFMMIYVDKNNQHHSERITAIAEILVREDE